MTPSKPVNLTPAPSVIDALIANGTTDHLCSRCRTPYGKSAIPCPNERKR